MSATVADLQIRISAETSQAATGMRQVESGFSGLSSRIKSSWATTTTSITSNIEKLGPAATSGFGRLQSGFSSMAARIRSGWSTVTSSISGGIQSLGSRVAAAAGRVKEVWGSATSSISSGISKLGSVAKGILTGSLFLGGLQVLTDKTIAYGEAIQRTNVLTGLGEQASARLSMEAIAAGSSVDVLTKRLLVLDKAAAPVNGKLNATGQTLQALGIQLTDQTGKLLPLDQQLGNIASAYAKAGDKAQFMANVFGPRGAALAPLIAHFDALQRATKAVHFPVPSEQDLIKLSLEQQRLQLMEVTIGQKVLPFFMNLTGSLATFADEIGTKGVGGALADLWDNLGTGQKVLVGFVTFFTAKKAISGIVDFAVGIGRITKAIFGLGAAKAVEQGVLARNVGLLGANAAGMEAWGISIARWLGVVGLGVGSWVAFDHAFKSSDIYRVLYLGGVPKGAKDLQGTLGLGLDNWKGPTPYKGPTNPNIRDTNTITYMSQLPPPSKEWEGFAVKVGSQLYQQIGGAWTKISDSAHLALYKVDRFGQVTAEKFGGHWVKAGFIVAHETAKVGSAVSTEGKAISVFAGMTGKALEGWKANVKGSFDAVASGLEDLSNRTHLSVASIVKDFNQQAKDLADYGKNLQTLESRNIPSQLLKQLLDMGPAGAAIVAKLASSSKADFGRMVESMTSAAKATQRLRGEIERLQSKSITITTRFVREYVAGGGAARQQNYPGGQRGWEGVVQRPTWIRAGEGGTPEEVTITPTGHRRGGSGAGVTIHNLVVNNPAGEPDAIARKLQDVLRSRGW